MRNKTYEGGAGDPQTDGHTDAMTHLHTDTLTHYNTSLFLPLFFLAPLSLFDLPNFSLYFYAHRPSCRVDYKRENKE